MFEKQSYYWRRWSICNCIYQTSQCVHKPQNSMVLGSRQILLRETKCSPKHVDRYLNPSETYTKFRHTRKRFPRLKVVSFCLNEVWSVDLADVQQLATENSGVRLLFSAVDLLSRFLWVTDLKSETSRACIEAPKKIIATSKQRNAPKPSLSRKKIGLIKVENLPVT